MDSFLLLASILVFTSFLLIPLTRKLGAPILLIVLAVGMLAGEDGFGGVQFDDFSIAYALGSLALAVILFGGGVETRMSALKEARTPAVLLATVGVVITTVIVGLAVVLIFRVSILEGLLLGAVVGSTDAAATFLLIRQNDVRLKPRLENTLVLESGINDPMAIFLTLVLTGLVNLQADFTVSSILSYLPVLVQQFGLGAIAGLGGGCALAWILNRLDLRAGIYPAMALAGAIAIFSGTSVLGGSGYLAAYLTGLVLRDRLKDSLSDRVVGFSEAMQWLSQIALFLMLGLLVTPHLLPTIWVPAALTAVILIVVARPVAVVSCLSCLGFSIREQAFVSWVGLRGAVPIFLAILPVITPGPVTVDFFNIVFIVVVISLVVQGWSIAASARWLGVDRPDPNEGKAGP